MKKFMKCTLPVVSAFVLIACGGSGSQDATHDADSATVQAEETTAAANPVLKNEALNAVYAHYTHLTAALTNSDAAEAKTAAGAMEADAKNLENGNTLSQTAAKIASTDDLEEQRKAYQTLTDEMIAKVKAAGLSSGEIYVEHCPMAFNNTGASWLSNSKDIRNPYFGEKMMTCGEVTETIQ